MKVINLKTYGVIVFNTELTKEAILKLRKHNPNALKLFDEEGNETFALSFSEIGAINEYGISFNKADSEGKALMTVQGTLENNEIAEEFAGILVNAKEVETKALSAYQALEAQLLEITNSIECIEATPEGGNEND